jgi:hypothetical protein
MKKDYKVLLFLSFLLSCTLIIVFINFYKSNSQSQSFHPIDSAKIANYKFRYVPNEAYGFGERLDYKVGYKFITAGTGYLQISPSPVYKYGRECYNVQFEVRSLESLDFLYRVRDAYSSIIDVSGIFPWEFTQTIREGNYKRDAKAYFDQFNKKTWTGNKSYDVPEYINDIVSAFYYVRTLDLSSMSKGTVFYLENFFDNKTWKLGVKILGKDVAEVDAGKFNCIVIEPLVVEGGLFKSEGSIYIWLTDDDRKIPVKVSTKIPIGYVEAKLTSYKGIRGPIKAKIQ